MTAEEFLKLTSEDGKAELINGVMILPSPALNIHERLYGYMWSFTIWGGAGIPHAVGAGPRPDA